MSLASREPRKPPIVISRSDHERLMRLAPTGSGREAQAADELFDELARARIVPDDRLPSDVVRLGAALRFRTDTGQERRVTLVFPEEADIAQGKVSVLTPIGAALIGLSAGQSIDWKARDGRTHLLTVESVEGAGAALLHGTPEGRWSPFLQGG